MKIIIAALAVISVLSIGIAGYFTGLLRFNYPSAQGYPVQGIDVSHHQGAIDWRTVPKEKVKFVYIKASEGGDWRDPKFKQNWNEARAAGFEVGAYHFFTLCKDGITQARNFMEIVTTDGEMMAPVVDLEYVGNCSARPSKEDFLRELNDFVQEWQVFYMKKPVFYTTKEFYEDYLKGSDFESYPLWLRDVFAEPDVKDYPSMVLWQYADNARVDGIKGPVDLNARLNTP